MSAQQNPPAYSDHLNYSQQPPQNVYPQTMPMPMPTQGYNQPTVFNGQQVYHAQPVPSVTVVTQQPSAIVVRTIPILGPEPVLATCPNCYRNITTLTKHEISGRTHCCALGLCLVGLWPCAIFPYICGGCCQKTTHKCPSCGHYIGSS